MKNHMTDQDVADFRYLFISQFDIDLTENEARDYGYWLLETVKLIFADRIDMPIDMADYSSGIKED